MQSQPSPSGASRLTRRTLLHGLTAAASSAALAPFIHARTRQEGAVPGGQLPSRLKLAAVGTGNRAVSNIAGVLSEDVAVLCDVDEGMLAQGVAQVKAAGQAAPKTYRDWRDLLSQETDLDGIVISTPDHTHAVIAREALSLAKPLPVYCEKPLTRTVYAAQELRRLAKKAGVATQMGTQIHATENYRRVVEALRADAIGPVHTVDVVCSKSWSGGSYPAAGAAATPVPKGLDWDLWLGPTPERDYVPGVHPANWRRYWQFGSGTVGDMAAHWLDLVHWALELAPPTSIRAEGPEVDAVGTPKWMHASWYHPSTVPGEGVDVHWWDGGRKPDNAPLDNCHIFRGTKGTLTSTYSSMDIVRNDPKGDPFELPAPSIMKSPGHYVEWLQKIKDPSAPDPLCHFDYSGPLTEAILLAGVAYRAGGEITWDAKSGRSNAGLKFLKGDERPGWRL